MMDTSLENNPTVRRLREHLPTAVAKAESSRGEVTLWIEAQSLVEACRRLRDDAALQYNFLSDLTAVDYVRLPQYPRFVVVYHLYSLPLKHRVRLKVVAQGDPPSVPSVVPIWSAANWHEREVFDLFGIHITGHPDLRRIMMPDDWEGHPLRKDYPEGRQEVAFSYNTPAFPEHRAHMRRVRPEQPPAKEGRP